MGQANVYPLDGIRVLDAGTGIGPALAAMLLADFGAEVVRVEPPSRPERIAFDDRAPGAAMWHRHKRIVRRELRDVAALADAADVVITTSDTDAAALGLGSDRSLRSDLIHVSMPPVFTDLELDSRTADALAAAWAGVARRQSSFSGGPVESVYPLFSYIHGVWGATCAVATLIERQRSGLGQRVTVDGWHALLVAAATTIVVDLESTPPVTNVGSNGPNPTYSTYKCADGKWLFLGALSEKFQDRAMGLLGVMDILDDPRIAHDRTKLYAVPNRAWVRERMAAAFASRPRQEWLDDLEKVDCPASAVQSRDDWLAHPQVAAMRQRRELTDPVEGDVVMPWVPPALELTPARDPAPRQFVESADWADRDAIPTTYLPSRTTSTGPLSGFHVIDLGTVLAGPYAGMMLAELGADVVKLEPPSGDAFRVRGYQHNRGLRGLALDLRDERGKRALDHLLAATDVMIDNFRPGVLEKIGLDRPSLADRHPGLITVSITGFGSEGPLGGAPGFDPVLQAMTGIMAAQGGADEPVFSTVAVNDVGAACFSALGSVMALMHKVRTGEGQQVGVSLASTACYMQCGELLAAQTDRPAPVGGRDFVGSSPLRRYYTTSDGYVRVEASSVAPFVAAGLVPDGTDERDLAQHVEQAAAELTTADVVERLRAAGAVAMPARTYIEMVQDAPLAAGEYIVPVKWADGRTTFLPGRLARLSRTEREGITRPPGVGEHTRDVLSDYGLGPDDVQALIDDGISAHGEAMTSVVDVGYR